MNNYKILSVILLVLLISVIIYSIIIENINTKNMECADLYYKMREISRSDGHALGEKEAFENMERHVKLYVKNDCRPFADLDFWHQQIK